MNAFKQAGKIASKQKARKQASKMHDVESKKAVNLQGCKFTTNGSL